MDRHKTYTYDSKNSTEKEATEGVADDQTTAEKNVDENAESVEKIVEEIVKNDQ